MGVFKGRRKNDGENDIFKHLQHLFLMDLILFKSSHKT